MNRQPIINGKFKKQRSTGVQLYAKGILPFLENVELKTPPFRHSFVQAIWEQFSLPIKSGTRKSLLINFCNTAPFWYKNQIVTIHDMAVFENPDWFRPAFAKYYQCLFKQLAKNAKHFVTVSEFSKHEMMKHLAINPNQITVIHSAPKSDWKSIKPLENALLKNQPFMLMVGSHDPRKNFEFVIYAAQQWRKDKNYKLVIAGNPGKAFAKQKAANKTDVIWLQNLSDGELKWLYQNANLVIHPSLYEGFSLVPLEAHLLGAKTLISDIVVHREIAGETARYFELGDEEDLLKQLEQSIKAPFEKKSLPYSFEKSAEQWAELIFKVNG